MVILEEIKKSQDYEQQRNIILARKLNNLASRSGYNIIQTNGQRIYAPPPSMNIPVPPKGSEIFIGKLTKRIYEDELIPLFEKIGRLYKFRMMLDFTERTRGYAFATYFNPEDADRAVKYLNKYEIRQNLFIGVFKSVDNCRLFIGNIPLDKTSGELFLELRVLAHGLVNIIMFQDPKNPLLNRGFAFLEFETHRHAAMARRQFTPNNLILWNTCLYVDWADPIPAVDSKIMEKVKILYLNNLPIDYSSEDIKACICTHMSSQMITRVYKYMSYAFVHFNTRSSAKFALFLLKDFWIGNYKINVEWARPRRYGRKQRWGNPPENFCTSVPPALRRIVYTHKNSRLNITSSSTASNSGSSHKESFDSSHKDSFDSGYYTPSKRDGPLTNSRCSSVTPTVQSTLDDTYDGDSDHTYVNADYVPGNTYYNNCLDSSENFNQNNKYFNDSVNKYCNDSVNKYCNDSVNKYCNDSVNNYCNDSVNKFCNDSVKKYCDSEKNFNYSSDYRKYEFYTET